MNSATFKNRILDEIRDVVVVVVDDDDDVVVVAVVVVQVICAVCFSFHSQVGERWL